MGNSTKGPEGEGLLPGQCAGRMILGGNCVVSLPQTLRFDLHTGPGVSFGEAFRGPPPGITQGVRGTMGSET